MYIIIILTLYLKLYLSYTQMVILYLITPHMYMHSKKKIGAYLLIFLGLPHLPGKPPPFLASPFQLELVPTLLTEEVLPTLPLVIPQ